MRTATLLLAALTLASCGSTRPPRDPKATEDLATVALAAWERQVPFALQAGYALTVSAPTMGVEGSTRGGLVVHRPGRFRLEVFSPLGTPLLYAVSDSQQLGVFDVRNNTYYSTGDAEALLRGATGGSAGVDDLVSLMIGRLPFEDAEVIGARIEDDLNIFTFAGPDGTKAEVALDERTLTTRRVEAFDSKDQLVLIADYQDYLKVGGSRLPEEVTIEVPQLQLTVELEFNSWDELGRIPDAFTLPRPPGSTQVMLDEWVKQVRSEVLGVEAGAAEEAPAEPPAEPPAAVEPPTPTSAPAPAMEAPAPDAVIEKEAPADGAEAPADGAEAPAEVPAP